MSRIPALVDEDFAWVVRFDESSFHGRNLGRRYRRRPDANSSWLTSTCSRCP